MVKHCPKCYDTMVKGVIGGTLVAEWYDIGEQNLPEDDRRQWRGHELQNRQRGQALTAYKCGNCGYVELFAEPQGE